MVAIAVAILLLFLLVAHLVYRVEKQYKDDCGVMFFKEKEE